MVSEGMRELLGIFQGLAMERMVLTEKMMTAEEEIRKIEAKEEGEHLQKGGKGEAKKKDNCF